MTVPRRIARLGVTLRHWTTNTALFVGERNQPSLSSADHALADGRSRNLLVSKLRRLKARAWEQVVPRGKKGTV
jgi:hypothetical protein